MCLLIPKPTKTDLNSNTKKLKIVKINDIIQYFFRLIYTIKAFSEEIIPLFMRCAWGFGISILKNIYKRTIHSDLQKGWIATKHSIKQPENLVN